jgi:hypothetical protein
MKDNLSLKNIWRRIKGASPSFFVKVQWVCVSAGVIGGGIMILATQYPTAFPEGSFWVRHASTLLVMGLFGGLLAKLPLKENTL